MEIQSVGDNPIFREPTIDKKVTGKEALPSGKAQQEPTYSKADLDKEIEHLNSRLQSTSNSHLQFVLHDKLNEYYVRVVDNVTNEVIKEIPSKKMMDIVASFYERIGIIIDKKI